MGAPFSIQQGFPVFRLPAWMISLREMLREDSRLMPDSGFPYGIRLQQRILCRNLYYAVLGAAKAEFANVVGNHGDAAVPGL